ncbi:MAG: hypothetical protein EPO28_18230 [Saprospiraceae bacterium]|nr:MAG: hypothetical protein EPO28_18230 [Saprospiraceae bacterium]
MKTQLFFALLLLLFCGLAQSSCKNETSGNHAAALPQNNMTQAAPLTAQDAQKLARAKGMTATPVSAAELSKMTATDTTALIAVVFWKMACLPCLDVQRNVQAVQLEVGESRFKILSVNLDQAGKAATVQYFLRTAGITAPVYQITDAGNRWPTSIAAEWKGTLPCLLLKSRDGWQQLYQESFSKDELTALVQPFLL